MPNGFQITQKRFEGIDLLVGEIKNGKSKFIFDYGWYSTKVPPSGPKNLSLGR